MPLRTNAVSSRTYTGTGSAQTTAVTSLTAVVLSVDSPTNKAVVRDQLGNQRTVATTRMFGKGVAPPAVGETWLLTSMFGGWIFAVQVNPTYEDLVLSGDSRLSNARTPTGPAGGALGGTYPNPTVPAPSVSLIGASGQPAYQNGWSNTATSPFVGANFYKDVGGIVHLAGVAASGTISTTSAIFVLPANYRPGAQSVYSVAVGTGVGQIRVASSGQVIPYSGSSGNWFLDGITFLAVN